MKRRNRNGFTLAELLIVVAIIAVLVAVAVPTFSSQIEKSRQAVDVANLRDAYAIAKLAEMMQEYESADGVIRFSYLDTEDDRLVFWCDPTDAKLFLAGTSDKQGLYENAADFVKDYNSGAGHARSRVLRVNTDGLPTAINYSWSLTSGVTSGTAAKGILIGFVKGTHGWVVETLCYSPRYDKYPDTNSGNKDQYSPSDLEDANSAIAQQLEVSISVAVDESSDPDTIAESIKDSIDSASTTDTMKQAKKALLACSYLLYDNFDFDPAITQVYENPYASSFSAYQDSTYSAIYVNKGTVENYLKILDKDDTTNADYANAVAWDAAYVAVSREALGKIEDD